MSASSDAMRMVELFELQAEEGPCLDCYRSGTPVRNDDLATAGGQLRFASVAVAAGFRAADALPMRLRNLVAGALNLFRNEPGSLNAQDVAVAQALADVATIALVQHRIAIETARHPTAARRPRQPSPDRTSKGHR